MTRNPLLPVLAGSRAVLVGRDVPEPDADYRFGRGWESAEVGTKRFSQVLVSPVHQAFEMTGVVELVGDSPPAEVIEAVCRAAAEVSDTLLFFYAATGPVGDQSELATVAEIMRGSAATRLVVLLDCPDISTAASHFLLLADTEPDRVSLLAGGRSMLFSSEIDPLTSNLTEVIAAGVEGGSEALDLFSLGNAVRAKYTELREAVENEWIPGEKSLICYAGKRVALGINLASPPSGEEPLRREVARSVGPRGPWNFRNDAVVMNAVSALTEVIRAAAPASWTPKEGTEPEDVAVKEPTAENEAPGRYVWVVPGARRLKVFRGGGNVPWTSAWTFPDDPRLFDADTRELIVRQLHVDGMIPAPGFSATAAVHVLFPSRQSSIEAELRALIALRVPGWTATAASDSVGARWRVQDPEDQGRSISIETEPGGGGGDVTVIGRTALGVEQRILLPHKLSRPSGFHTVPLGEAVEALTVMGVLPVVAQWGVAR
ncbi:hypothetical protein FB565_008611 [Actinoplanes lutulentus]|nr:hypothetical protein [Actinoplanes lutulentus]MBB2948825.1 hypothetical protein [Actinoplanes lutulentus]